jgi:hypothetical protein
MVFVCGHITKCAGQKVGLPCIVIPAAERRVDPIMRFSPDWRRLLYPFQR